MIKSSFLLLYMIILFLQQISAHNNNNNQIVIIKIACAQTKARELCISVIKSDPRSASGDVRVFSKIVLEKALSRAEGLKDKCPETYRKLVEDAGDAIEKLKTKEIEALVEDSIKDAINDVVNCPSSDDDDSLVIPLLNIAKDVLKIIN